MLEQEVEQCKTDLGNARDMTSMNEQEVVKSKTDLSKEYYTTNKMEDQEVAA